MLSVAKQVSSLNLCAAGPPLEKGTESSTRFGVPDLIPEGCRFPDAMGNKQQRRAREVLGCCSRFQKTAGDIRESDVIFSQILQKIG